MNNIATKTNGKGQTILLVNNKKVAAIAPKKNKIVVFALKRISTDITVFQKAFNLKNTKKTIKADSVEVCSTYTKTNGKDPCFAIVKFPTTASVEEIQDKLVELATKSGNYEPAETPSTKVAEDAETPAELEEQPA